MGMDGNRTRRSTRSSGSVKGTPIREGPQRGSPELCRAGGEADSPTACGLGSGRPSKARINTAVGILA